MTTVTKTCGKCGAKIFADAPQEFCSACLLETGLNLLANERVTEVGDAGRDDGVAVPNRKKAASAGKMLGDFGDYELLQEMGRGGQGVVYRARQKSLNRIVALKVIGLGHWATEAHLKRFRREAEAAASLEHLGIVPIYEVGERDGACYFSMKFVEGGQLDELTKSEPMPTRRAAELIAKVARTVHYAHEHGILHRDIKPGNILLDGKGEPHLTDFGLARLVETESTVTRTLEVLGTPSYMAPEQAVGNNAAITGATDVYGLGAVLYQLLTGHPPFAGGTTYETIRLLLDTEPRQPRAVNPKIDRDLSTICLKCLEKDPKRRYSSALALAEDLERWLNHKPIRARHTGVFARWKKWVRRNPGTAVMTALLLALAVPLGVMIWKSETGQLPANLAAPEKSIAVLPFSNLSKEPENAFFADGVQDEILTDLARIADLKVISRTSVMHYRSGAARNLREVGRQLGVGNVVEGSVQRAGNRVRVNAQLVDARSDKHLWAQTYDRDLADVFAIQSEIAKTIADQLQAKLSPNEKKAIEERPTADIAAFDLYSRGKTLILTPGNAPGNQIREGIDLLNKATAQDPTFHTAFCQLVFGNDRLYAEGVDHTPERLKAAESALSAAEQLKPDSPETPLARAYHLYFGLRDYEGAQAQLEIAGRGLPNDWRIPALKGYIARRKGKGEEGIRLLKQAMTLDPRNVSLPQELGASYDYLRQYAEEAEVYDRALQIEPDNPLFRVLRTFVDWEWHADPGPMCQLVGQVRSNTAGSVMHMADFWFLCALSKRDWAGAEQALAALGDNPCWGENVLFFSRQFGEGLLARAMHDDARARRAFTAARVEQEQLVQKQKDYGPPLLILGLIDAGLGDKEAALQEGRRAMELLPREKDATNGEMLFGYFAIIAAWAGEKDLALDQLNDAIPLPGATLITSYGILKLMPFWDPLRGDPRFEKIVASQAPKQ